MYSPSEFTVRLRNAVRDSISKGYERYFDKTRLGDLKTEFTSSTSRAAPANGSEGVRPLGDNRMVNGGQVVGSWTWERVRQEYDRAVESGVYERLIPQWRSHVRKYTPSHNNKYFQQKGMSHAAGGMGGGENRGQRALHYPPPQHHNQQQQQRSARNDGLNAVSRSHSRGESKEPSRSLVDGRAGDGRGMGRGGNRGSHFHSGGSNHMNSSHGQNSSSEQRLYNGNSGLTKKPTSDDREINKNSYGSRK